ncbi:TPA: hypothetical protein JLI49_004430 [Escherichia coli]|nr:hypothetical protein [Escherichia coli]HAW0238057.1 hypothetical protein [Escherichia coli]
MNWMGIILILCASAGYSEGLGAAIFELDTATGSVSVDKYADGGTGRGTISTTGHIYGISAKIGSDGGAWTSKAINGTSESNLRDSQCEVYGGEFYISHEANGNVIRNYFGTGATNYSFEKSDSILYNSLDIVLPTKIQCDRLEPSVTIIITGTQTNTVYYDSRITRDNIMSYTLNASYRQISPEITYGFTEPTISLKGIVGTYATAPVTFTVTSQSPVRGQVVWPEFSNLEWLQGDTWVSSIEEELPEDTNNIQLTHNVRVYGNETGQRTYSVPVQLTIY